MANKYTDWATLDQRHAESIADQRILEEGRAAFPEVGSLPEAAQRDAALAEFLGKGVNYPVLAGEVGVVNKQYPYGDVRRFGAVGDGVTDDTTAVQNAILSSLKMSSLSDSPPGEGNQVIPVMLSGKHKVATVYCPSGTDLRGVSPRRQVQLQSTASAPILVLGRNLAESGAYTATFRDFTILGSQSTAGQHGMQCQLSGGGNGTYIARVEMSNIKIDSCGGSGIRLMGDDVGNMMLYGMFDEVIVRSCNEYGMHVKIGVFNQNEFTRCGFSNNLLGGFYDEYFGSGTTPSENLRFQTTSFEGNGRTFLNEANQSIGSFGFKSNRYSAHVTLDTCYFEGNGNNPADTTGANIWVQNAWNCTVRNSINASSNNLFWVKNGGILHVDGCFLNMGASSPTAVFTLDGAPTSSAYSFVIVGTNVWFGAPTDAQRVRVINGSLTQVIGYQGNTNYVATPPRFRRMVLRDGSTRTTQDGSFSWNAARRVLNNADSAVTIPVDGIGTIIDNTFTGLLVVHASNTGVAIYTVLATGVITLGTVCGNMSATKDTASKVNVYHDGVLGAFVAQNKTAAGTRVSCRFIGISDLVFNDDGHYETAWGI